MKIFLIITFFLSALCILHTYFIYPLLVRFLSRGKQNNKVVFQEEQQFPFISVIMSVYNEEKVIEQKLESLLQQDYPKEKFAIFIGSDCSADQTNPLIENFSVHYPNLHFFPYVERRGKPSVINALVDQAIQLKPLNDHHIFLITDANVILTPQVMRNLAKHFKEEKIVIVDAHMVHIGMQQKGISKSENQYIASEVKLKHAEGVLWRKMAGPFGGCYAIRSPYFSKVPPTFLVDDFYITLKVFEKGGDVINDLDAICYEAVSHELREEYRRKSRISAGNFQNLFTFVHLWWPPFKRLNFVFFSHKVLRWFGPFFLLAMLLSSGILALCGQVFFQLVVILLLGIMILIPLFDFFLQKINFHIHPFRSVRYFLLMNVALLEGFLKYLKGVQNNVWEPPKRN